MRRIILSIATMAMALMLASGFALAAVDPPKQGKATQGGSQFTKSSMKPQSGDGIPVFVPANGARITAPDNPYRFRKTRKIAKLQRVTITVTLNDADTGTGGGDFDENDLFLVLDDINTGIPLNGFHDSQVDTRTISGIPNHREALKAALKEDGKLAATMIDRDPVVTGVEDNKLSVPASSQTTLRVKGTIRR